MLHCVYGIYHLSRTAGARSPASSAAYQLFSGVSDLCVLPLYAFGTLAVRNNGGDWETLLANQQLKYNFVPALYYTLIAAAGLHFLTMSIGLWLALKFKQIARMPPDVNPLEDHLTSRQHKRNKSSVAVSSFTENQEHIGTPLEDRRRSALPYEDLSRPPSIPFMATRPGSSSSAQSSRMGLPNRQYQITPGNSPKNSPRNSGNPAELDQLRRMSAAPSSPSNSNRGPWRGSYGSAYAEVPMYDLNSPRDPDSPRGNRDKNHTPRPSTGTVASQVTIEESAYTAQPRAAKFTEAWYASESLINRTQERNRALNALESANKRREYVRVNEGYNDDESDYGSDADHTMNPDDDFNDENDLGSPKGHHPNPLRSNPSLANVNDTVASPTTKGRRPNTPFIREPVLSEIDLNDRRVSGDITDSKPGFGSLLGKSGKRYTWAPGGGAKPSLGPKYAQNRNSSIQPETDFYSKPYGELKAATPPLVVGGSSERVVSSGNDYDMGSGGASRFFSFGRRNVSGKVAEEGLAGGQQDRGGYSRYGALREE